MADFRSEIRHGIANNLKRKFPQIERTKQRAIRHWGTEPTLTYYYYSINPINYAGEDNVRASFKSISHQGDVVIADHNSTDGIKEIAKEYGIKVLEVEPIKEHFFPESKMFNKIVHESKSNFLVYCNFNIVYPTNFDKINRDWLRNNDIKRSIFKTIGGIYEDEKHTKLKPTYAGCVSSIIYRPYILHARGYDERLYYKTGAAEYAIFMLEHLFRLRWSPQRINMKHRYYTYHGRKNYLHSRYDFPDKNRFVVYNRVEKMFKELKPDFSNVVNSYW